MTHRQPLLPILVTICLLLTALTGCTAKAPVSAPAPLVRNAFYFDTFIQIALYDGGDEALLDACMDASARFENLFSATKEGSDIWNINHANGEPVAVDPDTLALLETALTWSARTDGLFDVTIGAVSSLWNFSEEPRGPVPEEAAIRDALAHVGYRNIVIENNTVRLTDPDARIDAGAVAKGFIADRLKELLLSAGVKSALINLGGNVLAVGEKPGGDAFRIGVQTPFSAQGDSLAVVPVRDCSAVSSGNYERCFEEGGVLYHHILDPETGYPSDSGLVGITVLAPCSADADMLSTICFLLGAEKGLALIEETEGAEALFIEGTPGDTGSYRITRSSGFPE